MYVASNPHDSLPVTLTTEPMAVGLLICLPCFSKPWNVSLTLIKIQFCSFEIMAFKV